VPRAFPAAKEQEFEAAYIAPTDSGVKRILLKILLCGCGWGMPMARTAYGMIAVRSSGTLYLLADGGRPAIISLSHPEKVKSDVRAKIRAKIKTAACKWLSDKKLLAGVIQWQNAAFPNSLRHYITLNESSVTIADSSDCKFHQFPAMGRFIALCRPQSTRNVVQDLSSLLERMRHRVSRISRRHHTHRSA